MKNFMKKNILFIAIAVCVLLLLDGGLILKKLGYEIPDGREDDPVALALYMAGEGGLPQALGQEETGGEIVSEEPLPAEEGEETPAETGEEQAPDEEPGREEEPAEEEPEQEVVSTHWEFGPVDDTYFDEACFIGDSRIQGLYSYGTLKEHADFYSRTSMNVFSMLTGYMEGYTKVYPLESTDEYICPEDGLKENQYKYIYIMVGINELGTNDPDGWYLDSYTEAVERIKELQPDAKIILLAVLHVTTSQDDKGTAYNNTNIDRFNAAAMTLADNETVFWLDSNVIFDDGEGHMRSELSNDYMHLKSKYVPDWETFLYENGLVEVAD